MPRFISRLALVYLGLCTLPVRGYASGDENLAPLQALSEGFAAVAAQVKPGVVAVFTERTVSVNRSLPFRGTPFEHFFGPQFQPRGEQHQEGQGSGVVVRRQGEYYILTNNHVVKEADDIRVELEDERSFAAEVVGTDSLSDLALLKIDAEDLPAVPLGDSDELREGEWVLAIGNPFGYQHSITAGIVSALGRGRFGREYGSFIQTDAAINPGNSGGALVNLRGEMVGINTAIISRSGGYLGIGFAIPVNLAGRVMDQLIEHGEVRRGLLGAMIGDIDALTAEALGMKDGRGVLIQSVTEKGPADEAGIESGDVVVAMDGQPVKNANELRSRIGASPPGTWVSLRLLRDGKEKTIRVELGQLTAEVFAGGRPSAGPHKSELGLVVQDLSADIARQLGYEGQKGVVVSEAGGEAARRGLRRGDLIQKINHRPVESVADYEKALARVKPGEAVLMLVRRGEVTQFVGLRMPKN